MTFSQISAIYLLRPARGFSKSPLTGSLAQLVERFVYTEDVGSSSLSRPTIYPLEFLMLLLCQRLIACDLVVA